MSVPVPKSSLDLMQRNAEIREHFGDDAFFLTTRSLVIPESGTLEVVIDDNCPALVNNAHKEKIGPSCTDMLTLNEGRSKKMADMGYIALAAGGFVLFPDDNIALLKRDADAPILKNHWTSPSGMCGEHPFATADKETSEELAFFVPDNNLIIRLQPKNSPAPDNDNVLKNLGLSAVDSNKTPKVKYIELGGTECRREHGGRMVNIVIGSDIQRSEIPHLHHDEKHNLIALHQVFQVALGIRVSRIRAVDGEIFGREGGIFKIAQTDELPLVPTTKDYLDYMRSLANNRPELNHN